MKKIITYIQIGIFLAGFNDAFSQEFAPVGAKWYYNHTQPYNCSLLTKMESTGVTEINGKECKILETKHFYCYSNPDETLVLDSAIWSTDYFYRENDKIYHYDPFVDNFEVLYDFNAMPGDTITVRDTIFDDCDDINNYPPYYYCSDFKYIIDSVDTIGLGGNN